MLTVMLLVAIPKSASTSLMRTLALLHHMKAQQQVKLSLPRHEGIRYLHSWHSDMRELDDEHAQLWCRDGHLFKQHVFPSPNNLERLANQRVIVLLRDAHDIIDAYRRAQEKGLHNPRKRFKGLATSAQWHSKARELGLEEDLIRFNESWREVAQRNERILLLDYEDLMADATTVINAMERHWGLARTEKPVTLVRARYSRPSRSASSSNELSSQIARPPKRLKSRLRAAIKQVKKLLPSSS